jgi:biotin carboxyl carrier protein
MKFVAQHDERTFEVEVERAGSGYRVRLDDRWIHADLVNAGGYVRSLRLEDGSQFSLLHHREGSIHEITLAGSSVRVEIIDPLSLKRRREDSAGSGGIIKALMPGRVTRILVGEGDSVRKGAGLLILEAMKMENEIPAPADGTVDRIFVSAGQTVEGGADLLHLAPAPP